MANNSETREKNSKKVLGMVRDSKHCGPFEVTEYINADCVTVVFLNTGTKLQTKLKTVNSPSPRLSDPLAPSVFGVGRIGVGEYLAHSKGADTKEYSIWRAMLRRCYYRGDGVPRKKYDGVTVCEEWLDFQIFARWFHMNYPTDGGRYELDKDALDPGAREYSPRTCSFITKQHNLSLRNFKK